MHDNGARLSKLGVGSVLYDLSRIISFFRMSDVTEKDFGN